MLCGETILLSHIKMARSIKLKAFQFILFSSLHSALLPVARLLETANFYRELFDEIYASFEYVCHFMRFFHEHSQNSIKDVKYTRLTSAQKKYPENHSHSVLLFFG